MVIGQVNHSSTSVAFAQPLVILVEGNFYAHPIQGWLFCVGGGLRVSFIRDDPVAFVLLGQGEVLPSSLFAR